MLSYFISISLFFTYLIKLEKKCYMHTQWHSKIAALSPRCFKHFRVWTGKQKNITVQRLVKYLMYQIPWKSESKTDPSAIQMVTRFFYVPRKKPAKKANLIFKNPASTTNRQPAANTSTNRQLNQICCTLSEHFTYTSRAEWREGFICKE